MITELPDTTTKAIAAELSHARERHSLATGRVLTLLVAIDDARDDSIDETLATLRDASFEHPARVLVLISGDPDAETRLDAQVLVATDAGASEVERSWEILDPVLNYWAEQGRPDDYAAGTWGPASAERMLAKDGRAWRRP